MKQIKCLVILLFAMTVFASCDTYGDYKQDFSPVYPLSGQYYVTVYDANNVALSTAYLYLYNTTDNATDKLWIKLGSSTVKWGILGKIGCDVDALQFSGTAPNLAFSTDGATSSVNFTVASGKVTLDGATTPTNGKSDAIAVTFTTVNGTYTATGFRHTGWDGDE